MFGISSINLYRFNCKIDRYNKFLHDIPDETIPLLEQTTEIGTALKHLGDVLSDCLLTYWYYLEDISNWNDLVISNIKSRITALEKAENQLFNTLKRNNTIKLDMSIMNRIAHYESPGSKVDIIELDDTFTFTFTFDEMKTGLILEVLNDEELQDTKTQAEAILERVNEDKKMLCTLTKELNDEDLPRSDENFDNYEGLYQSFGLFYPRELKFPTVKLGHKRKLQSDHQLNQALFFQEKISKDMDTRKFVNHLKDASDTVVESCLNNRAV